MHKLTATMSLESLMPARCWIAPEMPKRHVKFRSHDLACLWGVICVACIHSSTRSSNRSTKCVRERIQGKLEGLGILQSPSPRNNAAGDSKVRFRERCVNMFRWWIRHLNGIEGSDFNLRCIFCSGGCKCNEADSQKSDGDGGGCTNCGDAITSVDRMGEGSAA